MILVGKLNIARILRALASCAFMLAASFVVVGQTGNPPSIPRPTPDNQRDGIDFSTRESEIRTRMALKAEKKAYEEHLARAKEARQIAGDLRTAFEQKHSFSGQERKRLERLEKLTKRIRNEAGGSETNADPKDLPTTIDLAITALAEMTEELCKAVENTPRRIVSASIIDRANKLISVIQYVRDTTR